MRTQSDWPTRSRACLTRCGGNSLRLDGSKHPFRARVSIVLSTSVAVIDRFEDLPLRWIGLKPRSISGKIRQLQVAPAPLESLADLTANLTKSRPAQIEAWKRPLQEGRTVRVTYQIDLLIHAPTRAFAGSPGCQVGQERAHSLQ